MESSIESFVQGCPIVDNHCHPLVSESQDAGSSSQLSLLGSLSEASGPALQDAKNSISVKVSSSAFSIWHLPTELQLKFL